MRWRFSNANSPTETADREKVLAKIDAWWKEFQSRAADLTALFNKRIKWDLPKWMHEHLGAINQHLMWEYGPAVRASGDRLVITPESHHHLRPLVRAILQRAPAIADWEFYEYRLAEDMQNTIASAEARTGINVADFKFRACRSRKQLIDLEFLVPATSDSIDSSARNAAFVAVETLLGEECLDHWIGAIEVTPQPPSKGILGWFGRKANKSPEHYPLERLKDTVDALIGSTREQLPVNPYFQWVTDDESENQTEWTLWELKPEEAEDYPEQEDMFVGRSVNPDLWTTAHSGSVFYSGRFSRCGETFVYIKLDGSEGLDQERFADKSEIEDALDALLRPSKLGCCIGGGTGKRYSYIDLALTDVDQAIPLIRNRLQAGKVPLRSWVQFFDTDLAAEWVGIYDETPTPPMRFDE